MVDYRDNVLSISGIEVAPKTSDTTVFIENSGKVISDEKAKELLVGKQATVISDKEGTDTLAKVVLFQETIQ